jgi:hypothetical protein
MSKIYSLKDAVAKFGKKAVFGGKPENSAPPVHETVSRAAYDQLANEIVTLKQAVAAKDAKIASLEIDVTKANLLAADAVAQVDRRAAIRAIEVMAAAGCGPVISRASEKPGQQQQDETATGINRMRQAIRGQIAGQK